MALHIVRNERMEWLIEDKELDESILGMAYSELSETHRKLVNSVLPLVFGYQTDSDGDKKLDESILGMANRKLLET